MSMNQDAAFLSLLSSQRQLLNQLNQEKKVKRECADDFHRPPSSPPRNRGVAPIYMNFAPNHPTGWSSNHPPITSNSNYPPHHPNGRRSSLDLLLGPRRLSLALGPGPASNDQMLLPNLPPIDDHYGYTGSFDTSSHSRISVSNSRFSHQNKRVTNMVDDSDLRLNKKRRLSSMGLGFLTDAVLEEDFIQGRRLSMLSGKKDLSTPVKTAEPVTPTHSIGSDTEHTDTETESDDHDDDGDQSSASESTSSIEPIQLSKEDDDHDHNDDDDDDEEEDRSPRLDPAEMRQHMIDFSSAMEKSQKSQQDIHDWDRKMGLKRSHSKTMRLSSRSRKQLRAILKKEIQSICIGLSH